MLSALFGFVKAKPTLVLAALVSLALLGLYLALVRTEAHLAQVNKELGAAKIVMDQQRANLETLNQLRAKDSLVVGELVKDLKRLNQADTSFRDKIRLLENSNAQVRDYLSQPVPAELGCLLDGTCSQNPAP